MSDAEPREIASGPGGRVWFAEDAGGRRPAEEFLRLRSERKERKAKGEISGVLRLFELMAQEGRIVNTEHFRHEEDGLWVFKGGAIRIFAFQDCKTWYLTNGYRKQGQKVPAREFKRAKRIREEHRARGMKGR